MMVSRVTVSRSKEGGFDQKLVELRRVTRVVAGGKRMSFRAVVVLGDHKGQVGIGVAKGKDVARATDKAVFQARKNIISVPLVHATIPYEVTAKHSSAHVLLKPAKQGHGLVAGGVMRVVLSFAGIKDITAKVLGRTPNKLTNAMATMKALGQLKSMAHK